MIAILIILAVALIAYDDSIKERRKQNLDLNEKLKNPVYRKAYEKALAKRLTQ